MLTDKMIIELNRQITLEQYSSNLYLQMAAWCDAKGYVGSAQFLKVHADEELMHMHKLFNYVLETGAMPVLASIDAPPSQFENLGQVFKQTLDHEIFITRSINNLVASAFEEKDFSTFNFLQWYVSEQHEEENLFKGILDKIEIIGLDGKGIYYLDKEIQKLATGSAPLASAE